MHYNIISLESTSIIKRILKMVFSNGIQYP